MKPEIDILLARYFGGEASNKEMTALDDWLAASPDNEAEFERMSLIFERAVMQPPVKADAEKAFAQFTHYIRRSKSKPLPQKGIIRTIAAVAVAAACTAAVIGLFFTDMFRTATEKVITTASTVQASPVEISTGIAIQPDTSTTVRYIAKANTINVKLEGKARFDADDADKKLTVSANMTFVDDIGTQFSVTAYPDDDRVTVDVENGEVHFYTSNDPEGINLTGGMTGIYHICEKRFEKLVAGKRVAPVPVVFNAATLRAVAAALSAQYGITILVDGEAARKQITVSFAGDESVGEMLEIIAETLSLELRQSVTNYELKTKTAN